MKYITVWHNLNYDTYNYKIVKFCNYKVGYVNKYDHELILIINFSNICDFCYNRKSIRFLLKKVLRKLIFFLQNILKKL